jgi:hypothetical protein
MLPSAARALKRHRGQRADQIVAPPETSMTAPLM